MNKFILNQTSEGIINELKPVNLPVCSESRRAFCLRHSAATQDGKGVCTCHGRGRGAHGGHVGVSWGAHQGGDALPGVHVHVPCERRQGALIRHLLRFHQLLSCSHTLFLRPHANPTEPAVSAELNALPVRQMLILHSVITSGQN